MEFETVTTAAELQEKINQLPPEVRKFVMQLITNPNNPAIQNAALSLITVIDGVLEHPDRQALAHFPFKEPEGLCAVMEQKIIEAEASLKNTLSNREKTIIALFTLSSTADSSIALRLVNPQIEKLFGEPITHITSAYKDTGFIDVNDGLLSLTETGAQQVPGILRKLKIQ